MTEDDEIDQRARELADAAPPIPDERRQRLRALFVPCKRRTADRDS